MIRVLLVDDEGPARDHLRALLSAHSDVEILGYAEDGEHALELIPKMKPDLVFLDIQMPGCNGLEVAAALAPPRPKIIFCTAFDQYAVEAFEVHAVDYVLKPLNPVRLAKALDRVRETRPGNQDEPVDKLLRAGTRLRPRFLAKHSGRYRVIAQEEVNYFAIEEGLTALHTAGERCWMEITLAELERRLDPSEYVRISREHIVRIAAVSEVSPLLGGYGEVALKSGDRLRVSRRRLKDLLDTLGAIH